MLCYTVIALWLPLVVLQCNICGLAECLVCCCPLECFTLWNCIIMQSLKAEWPFVGAPFNAMHHLVIRCVALLSISLELHCHVILYQIPLHSRVASL